MNKNTCLKNNHHFTVYNNFTFQYTKPSECYRLFNILHFICIGESQCAWVRERDIDRVNPLGKYELLVWERWSGYYTGLMCMGDFMREKERLCICKWTCIYLFMSQKATPFQIQKCILCNNNIVKLIVDLLPQSAVINRRWVCVFWVSK